MHDDVIDAIAPAGALQDPTRAQVRAWLGDVVAFFEANRALVDAHHQAMPVEPRVAQRWWRGYEAMADALPALWRDERDRLRIIAALVGLERMCWYHVVADVPMDGDAMLDALTEDSCDLLRRPSVRAVA